MLTFCFCMRRLTVVKSLAASSVIIWDSNWFIHPSMSSQLCSYNTDLLESNNFSPLALVARSSSSHCSCRLARIGSICSLVSGLSWSRSSPAYNIPHWFIVNDVLKYIKGLPKLLVIMHKFTKISYYFKILYQEQWTFDNYYISISAWLKLHKTLNTV